ncbi:hypothetical protein DL89DRAFT_283241 [Linderina pennispora]|uniref:Uncharacterized protein n=1 Tax=Linderina pennispora TaxID=61395 RepID=A0A1Y1WAW7_9FUNG|nr:uncharacterized protein DL89DRAFT_283241 [Linderina pennispora]ORX70679.1 hypothetical protein DL89DRAFT_283241 [Linderina pennispora]
MQPRHEQLAAHLEGGAVCSIYVLRSQPDASVQWRLLADRRTLELRSAALGPVVKNRTAACILQRLRRALHRRGDLRSQLLPTCGRFGRDYCPWRGKGDGFSVHSRRHCLSVKIWQCARQSQTLSWTLSARTTWYRAFSLQGCKVTARQTTGSTGRRWSQHAGSWL